MNLQGQCVLHGYFRKKHLFKLVNNNVETKIKPILNLRLIESSFCHPHYLIRVTIWQVWCGESEESNGGQESAHQAQNQYNHRRVDLLEHPQQNVDIGLYRSGLYL